MSIATLCNPLILGLGNILLPRAVLAFKEGNVATPARGHLGSVASHRADGLVLLGDLARWRGAAVFALWQRGLRGACPPPFGASLFGSGPRRRLPAYNALISMEHPREIFQAEVLASTLTVALVWLLVGEWGLIGAAYASLIGNVVRTTGCWIAFLILAASHGNTVRQTGELGSTHQIPC